MYEVPACWKLSGGWSILERRPADNLEFELVIDTCDPHVGETREVIAHHPAWPDHA